MKSKHGAIYTNGFKIFVVTPSIYWANGFFVDIDDDETTMYLAEESMANWIINNELELVGYL